MLLQLGQEAVAGLLGIAEQHGSVLVEEDRVVNGSVADTEGPLHDDDLEEEAGQVQGSTVADPYH